MEYITPVLASLHWLPAKIRVDFKVLVFVFKALHGLAQIYISDLLHFYFPVRTLSSQKLLIVPKSCLKSKGNRAFSVLGPMLWNCLYPSDHPLRYLLLNHLFKHTFLKLYKNKIIKNSFSGNYFLCN